MSNFSLWKVTDLKTKCKQLGLKNDTKLSKSALISLIELHTKQDAATDVSVDKQPDNAHHLTSSTGIHPDPVVPIEAPIKPLEEARQDLTPRHSQKRNTTLSKTLQLEAYGIQEPDRRRISDDSISKMNGHPLVNVQAARSKREVTQGLYRQPSCFAGRPDEIPRLDDCLDSETRGRYIRTSIIPPSCIDITITDGFAAAVRFCISHYYSSGTFPIVKVAQRIAGDVWKLETEAGVVYTLGLNGENLGSTLRDDWQLLCCSPLEMTTLVRTKNIHDKPGGIARNFTGDRSLALRAVLSACSSGSFTGPKIELAQMDSEWQGRPIEMDCRVRRVQLYLPESRQVMSTHIHERFASLAIIHRASGYSNVVLKETGQVVGDEDQVYEPWEQLLDA